MLVASGRAPIASAQTPAPAASAASAASASVASVREALDRFCVRCHNDRTRTAGLALDTHDLAHVGADAETWERVIVKLRARTMPPAGSPRPAGDTYGAVASWLETEIDTLALATPDPGRGETFHRLNRAEYRAAVRDLLDVDVDVTALLPADDTYEHGFDNNGDVLSISPDLVGRYLSAARRISRLAVGIPPVGPAVATYRVHPGLLQDDRQDDLLSFGSRGGIAIRHYFPVDGEYTIRIRLHRNFSDYILGFAAPQELDVRVDGALVERFTVGDADSVGQMAPAELRREHRRGSRVGVLHEHRGCPSRGALPGASRPADRRGLLREAVLGAGGGAAAAQTRRLFADARSGALVDNFASQWLRLRNLDSQERESADYPEFDENLREAFRRETELFVESTLREDRSLLELLSANYTFVNERLARHYGIPGIYGDRFRRVTLDPDHPRGGLLGHGGLLMVTSYPNRTSPVVRGKWLLETILGAPPPEPPPNVPGLPDRGEGGEPASVRERLERHRANPACAGCHPPMDPLGFALENFDAIGTWRADSEAGQPIDDLKTDMNNRFAETNKRFESLGNEMNQRFDQVNRELADNRERMAKLEGALEGFLAGRRDRDAA